MQFIEKGKLDKVAFEEKERNTFMFRNAAEAITMEENKWSPTKSPDKNPKRMLYE